MISTASLRVRSGASVGRILLRGPDRRSARRSGFLLPELALEFERPRGEFGVLCLGEKGVKPAAMVDRFQCICRNPQPYRATESIGYHGHIHQIGHEPPLRLAVRMADLVSDLRAFAGQFASPSHGGYLFMAPGIGAAHTGRRHMALVSGKSREPIGSRGQTVKLTQIS